MKNVETTKNLSVEKFKKEDDNLYGTSSGLLSAIAVDSGLAEGVDIFTTFNLSADSVQVSQKRRRK